MTKSKIGRPSTGGRDPLVSFRIPAHLRDRVTSAARYMKAPTSAVFREALYIGLEHMHGERVERGSFLPSGLRPEHSAEIHEAGHAVVAWLNAEECGDDPYDAVDHVALKQRGAGHVQGSRSLSTEADVRFTVAGAVAEAMHTGLSFEEVWNGHGCSGDRRIVKRQRGEPFIDEAVQWVQQNFRDEDTWEALKHVARKLVQGKIAGWRAWSYFNAEREWCRNRGHRATGHFGEADDEPYQYLRVPKKRPRKR